MAQLPKKELIDVINLYEEEAYPRPHLGASILGHACKRYLVYTFFWTYRTKIPSKSRRIFSLGDAVEDIIVDQLQAVGVKHHSSQKLAPGVTPYGGGSIDGLVEGVPNYEDETLLFEAKSMNSNNFSDLQKKKVRLSKPIYYMQMQAYMGRLGLERALFVALNKNTSDLYVEIVEFNQGVYEDAERIEQDVVYSDHINHFPRVSDNPNWYSCKFCDAKDVCHYNAPVEKNCRTCEHVFQEDEWFCGHWGDYLSEDDQIAGCEHWAEGTRFKSGDYHEG